MASRTIRRGRAALGEVRSAAGFLTGLRPFLAASADVASYRSNLERGLADRERLFADMLRRAVFANAASPYRRLFEWSGITAADVERSLADDGLHRTLVRLYDAGVYVSLDELKGLQPLRRPGLELEVRAEDFDNPLTRRRYEARTGGSSGAARAVLVDLDLLTHEAAYHALFYAAAGADERPLAIWHPAPPGAVGIKTALIQARLGRPAERWFSQTALSSGRRRHAVFMKAASLATAAAGARIPAPEPTPARAAARVAAWLARKRGDGAPGILVTTPSGGVRASTAARDGALDIAGTLFVLVGEPYTHAKAAVIEQAAARAASHYAMAEIGLIGLACQAPRAPDDVHLVDDKVATIQRAKRVDAHGTTVQALFHTTVLAASPTVMVNVESGDYGVLDERDCGCAVLPRGFRRHLHSIRSYEKLTSEGMNFLGGDLLELVERVLPGRFGGHPADYQLAEREEGGLPRVAVVVSESVGNVRSEEVARVVLEFFRSRGRAHRMMADVWEQSGTLQVIRGEPHVTPGAKVLPLQPAAR